MELMKSDSNSNSGPPVQYGGVTRTTLMLQDGYDSIAKLRAEYRPDPKVALPLLTVRKEGELDNLMLSMMGMFSKMKQKIWPKGLIFDLPSEYLCTWHSPLPCVYWLAKGISQKPLVHVCPGYYKSALVGDDSDIVTCYPHPDQRKSNFNYLEIFNNIKNTADVLAALKNMSRKQKPCTCQMFDPVSNFKLQMEDDGQGNKWRKAKLIRHPLEEQIGELQEAVVTQAHVQLHSSKTVTTTSCKTKTNVLPGYKSRLSQDEQLAFITKIELVVSKDETVGYPGDNLKSLMHDLAGHPWMELWNRHDPNLDLQEYFRTGLFVEATDPDLISDFLTVLFLDHCSICEERHQDWNFDNLCQSQLRRDLVSLHGLPLPSKYRTLQVDFRSDRSQFELHQYLEHGSSNEFSTVRELRLALNPVKLSSSSTSKKARPAKCMDFRFVVPTRDFNLRVTMADEQRSVMERRLAFAVLHLRSENPGQRLVNFSPYQEYIAAGFDTMRNDVDSGFLENLSSDVHSAMVDDINRSFASCKQRLNSAGIQDWSVDRWKNNNLTVIVDHLASVLNNAGLPSSQQTLGYRNLAENLQAIASRTFPNSGVQLYLYADYLIRSLTPLVELENKITDEQYPAFCRLVVEAKQEARRKALSVRDQVQADLLDEFLNSKHAKIDLTELHLTKSFQEYSEEARNWLGRHYHGISPEILQNIVVDPSDDDIEYILERSSDSIVEESYSEDEARSRRTKLQEVCKLMLRIVHIIWPSTIPRQSKISAN